MLVNCHFNLQIILQARCSGSVEQSMALDDVHIIRDRFCNDIVPTTTPEPDTKTTAAPDSAMDCTFEQCEKKHLVETANQFVSWQKMTLTDFLQD